MPFSDSVFFGVLALVVWGLSDVLTKKFLARSPPFRALSVTLSTGVLAFLSLSLVFVPVPVIPPEVWAPLLLCALTGTVGWLAYYKALKENQASLVVPLAASWGIVPFALAIVFLAERLTFFQSFFSLAIFAGIALVSMDWKQGL